MLLVWGIQKWYIEWILLELLPFFAPENNFPLSRLISRIILKETRLDDKNAVPPAISTDFNNHR